GAMLAAESALGVLLGLVAQFIFAGVQLGSQLAGIQMGFGIANLIDPQTHSQVTIIAQWQQLLTLLVFLVLDVHHLLIRALLESFRTAAPGGVGHSAAPRGGAEARPGGAVARGRAGCRPADRARGRLLGCAGGAREEPGGARRAPRRERVDRGARRPGRPDRPPHAPQLRRRARAV